MRFEMIQALIVGSGAVLGGAAALFTALSGSPKRFEESDNPRMQELLARFGKTKLRIVSAVIGLIALSFGLKLLYGIFFIKQ